MFSPHAGLVYRALGNRSVTPLRQDVETLGCETCQPSAAHLVAKVHMFSFLAPYCCLSFVSTDCPLSHHVHLFSLSTALICAQAAFSAWLVPDYSVWLPLLGLFGSPRRVTPEVGVPLLPPSSAAKQSPALRLSQPGLRPAWHWLPLLFYCL